MMDQLSRLSSYLDKIESYIPEHEKTNTSISKATIGWQIDHSLKVINSVVAAVQKSDPASYANNLKFLGKVFLKLGYFPRGKAKAPKHVKPPELISKEDLTTQLEQARLSIKTIPQLDKNAYFKHPLFGNVNTKRVSRFLEVHTNHHIKIIRDIIN